MPRRPWHLRPIAVATLVLCSLAALDFVMALGRNATYLESLPAPLRAALAAWLDALPLWALAARTLAVWGALAGSVLLLAASRHAVACFAVALIGLAVQTAHALFLSAPPLPAALAPGTRLSALVSLLALLAIMAYARRLFQTGVLR